MQFGYISQAATPVSFTGETGGDWTLHSASPSNTATIYLQTAVIATAGTIDGGSMTIAAGSWAVRGYALAPASAASGILPMAKRFGGNPFSPFRKGIW